MESGDLVHWVASCLLSSLRRLQAVHAVSPLSAHMTRSQVLLGYLQSGELQGPFCSEPPWGLALPALGGPSGDGGASGPNGAGSNGVIGAPCDLAGFLAVQPVPEEGAFCYVVVDGVVPVDLKC